MKHKTINTIILATALSVAGLTHAVAANTQSSEATSTQQTTISKEDGRGKHHGGKHHGGKKQFKKFFKKLDLSEEQKEQMKTIITAHKEANKESRAAHKAEMKAFMEDPSFNETKATELIAQQEAQRTAKKLDMLKMKHEMYQLLTEEQKVKYDQREMMKKERQNRANR